VEALRRVDITFDATGAQQDGPFWARLGLANRGPEGEHYKVAGSICRAKYAPADLATAEGLQAASPRNVIVLERTENSSVYLQEASHGAFEAVGLFRLPDGEYDYEITVPAAEAFRAMDGALYHAAPIAARLLAGAREKAARDRAWRAEQEALALTEEEQEARETACSDAWQALHRALADLNQGAKPPERK